MLSARRQLAAVAATIALAVGLSGALAPAAVAGTDPGSPPAGPATAKKAMSHKNPKMVDLSTPYYQGYSKKYKAYRFTIYGRWNATCSGGKYCWSKPCAGSCKTVNMGSNDAVRIRFSDAVSFKRMSIQNLGACGTKYYAKTAKFSSGSFEDAYAGVNDEVVESWRHTTANGKTVINDGYCKRAQLPVTSGGAAGGGGSGTYAIWGDLKGRGFRYDVWVNPLPSRGRCYDRLYVKAGYTHTWTDQSLSWSAGYPWSIGVGVTSTSGSFTTWQNTDGHPDADLKTKRLCKH